MIKLCICGAEYHTKPSHADRRKYCSRVCMYKYRDMSALKGRVVVFKNPHPGWLANKKRVGILHPLWKGDQAGYRAIHIWINSHKEKTGYCNHCHLMKKTAWANVSREYKRELSDWIELCYPCHQVFDKEHKGAIARRFSHA